jgi:hypothetical protein
MNGEERQAAFPRRLPRTALDFRFERFAIRFFGVAGLFVVIIHDINRFRIALVAGTPVFAGVHFAQNVFCHC